MSFHNMLHTIAVLSTAAIVSGLAVFSGCYSDGNNPASVVEGATEDQENFSTEETDSMFSDDQPTTNDNQPTTNDTGNPASGENQSTSPTDKAKDNEQGTTGNTSSGPVSGNIKQTEGTTFMGMTINPEEGTGDTATSDNGAAGSWISEDDAVAEAECTDSTATAKASGKDTNGDGIVSACTCAQIGVSDPDYYCPCAGEGSDTKDSDTDKNEDDTTPDTSEDDNDDGQDDEPFEYQPVEPVGY